MELSDIDRLAKILALDLSVSEKESLYDKFLDTILKIEALKNIDVSEVVPTHSVTGLINVYQTKEHLVTTLSLDEALRNAPNVSKGLIIVEGDHRHG